MTLDSHFLQTVLYTSASGFICVPYSYGTDEKSSTANIWIASAIACCIIECGIS